MPGLAAERDLPGRPPGRPLHGEPHGVPVRPVRGRLCRPGLRRLYEEEPEPLARHSPVQQQLPPDIHVDHLPGLPSGGLCCSSPSGFCAGLHWKGGGGCYRAPGQPLLNRHQVGGVSRSPDGLFAQQVWEPTRGRPVVRGNGTYGGRSGQRVEEQGTWASHTQKHSEAGYGRPVDRGAWTAKTVKRPRQQPAHPQFANYWAPLTRKWHIPPHPAQPRHTNRERGNNTSRSTGHSSRQKAATRHNMRREERVTVQGPVRKQQPNGMSHRGGTGLAAATYRKQRPDTTCEGKNG